MSTSIVASGRRDIAAPYQQIGSSTGSLGSGRLMKGGKTGSNTAGMSGLTLDNPSASSTQNYPDYRSYQFQPLEPVSKVTFDRYVGCTPESNWVVPGKLLVGAYPASADDAETLDLITSILQHKVTKFVCLQQEYREHGVTEAMWRSGQALRPYFEDVRSIVKKKHLLPCLAGHDIVSEQKLAFTHFPIRDCSVTDDDRVLELARSLVRSIAEGHVIYLHCWGGHGRTGTLVCIMLHLMYGLNDKDAMHYCQTVHDLRQCPVVVGSPQTQTQRDQVSRVILSLMTQNRFNSRSMSGDASMLEQPQPALPSPVAKSGDILQSKLGSPRSATKQAPASATGASTAVPSLVQTAEATTISLGGVRADGLNDAVATNLTMPVISAAAPQPQTTDSGADVSLAFADSLTQEPQPQDEAVAAAPEDDSEDEETGAGRMRLGTMDDSDLYAELDDGEQPDSSMAVAMPSPVKEGEIEEGEMVEGSLEQEDQDDDDDDEMETPADEVRGVEVTAEEVQPQQPPPVAAKPSFRPLWRRNAA